jgi:hypothetical protein
MLELFELDVASLPGTPPPGNLSHIAHLEYLVFAEIPIYARCAIKSPPQPILQVQPIQPNGRLAF